MNDDHQGQFQRGMHAGLMFAAAHQPTDDRASASLVGIMTGLGVVLADRIGDEQFAELLEVLADFVRDFRKAHQPKRGN